jgi:hypothetical protein
LEDDENIKIKTIAKNFNLRRRTISKLRCEIENEADEFISFENTINTLPGVIVNRLED